MGAIGRTTRGSFSHEQFVLVVTNILPLIIGTRHDRKTFMEVQSRFQLTPSRRDEQNKSEGCITDEFASIIGTVCYKRTRTKPRANAKHCESTILDSRGCAQIYGDSSQYRRTLDRSSFAHLNKLTSDGMMNPESISKSTTADTVANIMVR